MVIVIQKAFDCILRAVQKVLLVESADQKSSVQSPLPGFLLSVRHLNDRYLFTQCFKERHEQLPRSQTVAAFEKTYVIKPLGGLHKAFKKLFHPVVGNFDTVIRSELAAAQIGKKGRIVSVSVKAGSEFTDLYVPVRIHEIIKSGGTRVIRSAHILQFKKPHYIFRIRNSIEIFPVMLGIEMNKTICQCHNSVKFAVSLGSNDHRSVKIPAVVILSHFHMNASEQVIISAHLIPSCCHSICSR